MFAGRHKVGAQATTAPQAEVDPQLRDEVDLDPVVEEMAERLRSQLGSLSATDEFGRSLAWRKVVRIALGPELTRLRDAATAAVLWDALADHDREAATSTAVVVAPQVGTPTAPDLGRVAPAAPDRMAGLRGWPEL